MKNHNFDDEYFSDVKNLQEQLIPGQFAPLDLAFFNISEIPWW